MQSLTLAAVTLLAATLLTGCGGDSGPTAESTTGLMADATNHNTVDHASYTIPLTETDVNPCNGETIEFTGSIVGQDNFVNSPETLNSGFDLHHEINEVVSETGVGLTTGAPYTLRAHFHEKLSSPTGTEVARTFSIQQLIRVTSTTPGLNYTVLTTIYFVGLPTGEYKFTKLVDNDYVCQG